MYLPGASARHSVLSVVLASVSARSERVPNSPVLDLIEATSIEMTTASKRGELVHNWKGTPNIVGGTTPPNVESDSQIFIDRQRTI